MIYKCLAIDDEPLALDIIADYVERLDFLELTAKCTSGLDALKILKNEHIDVIFLDIQMPELSGIDFLNSLNKKPLVIFTTAYENYAVDSYNFNAVDYLLKPFSFPRFLKAIDKIIEKNIIVEPTKNYSDIQLLDFIFINFNSQTKKILVKDIELIKGMSDYILLKTPNKNYIIRDNMKKIEEMLSGSGFVRVHKSYIIPLNKIESIEGGNIKIGEENIPIGRLYRNNLLNRITSRKIG